MRTATWAVLVMVAVAFGAAAPAWAAEPKGDEGPSSVTLSWEKFKAITGWDDAGKPGEGGTFTLTWKEVEDLVGVKVQNMDNAKVRIPWKEFKALLLWSIEQKKKPEAANPPSPWTVTSADYVGELSKDGGLFTATFKVRILADKDWKVIPVLPATVAIKEAKLPEGSYLRMSNNQYEVLTAAPAGDLAFTISFATAVREQAGTFTTQFARVPSGTGLVDLKVAQAGVDIQVAGAQSLVKKEEGGATRALAMLASAAPVQVTWERAIPEPEKVPPKLYSETQTLVAVGDGILVGRESVRFNILHAGVRVLKLTVPQGASILDVRGDKVRDWHVTGADLSVALSSEVIGDYALTVTFESTLGADLAKPVSIPVLRAGDVVREKGHIGVVALANVELSSPSQKGATAIDVRELPPELLGMTSQPILLAYRYVAEAFDIPLAIKKHEDVSVLLTLVDSAVITTMQTPEGRRITKAIYNVRNNRQQFLRLVMPQEAGKDAIEIWSASVSGKSIRPAKDDKGAILIPLVRSEGASSGLAAFPVEIVYVEKAEKALAAAGELKIVLPRASEPITHLMVNLYLPKEGNYRKGWPSSEAAIESPLAVVPDFRKLVGTMERPALNAQAVANDLQKQAQAQVDETTAATTGATPIRVNLPLDGQLFRLEKILVLDEPLFITVHYSGLEKK